MLGVTDDSAVNFYSSRRENGIKVVKQMQLTNEWMKRSSVVFVNGKDFSKYINKELLVENGKAVTKKEI